MTDSGFPRGGVQNYYYDHFYQKLHKDEKKMDPGGSVPGAYYLQNTKMYNGKHKIWIVWYSKSILYRYLLVFTLCSWKCKQSEVETFETYW